MSNPLIFLLGATGYVGSEFLILLGQELSHLPVVALVRAPTTERRARLHELHSNLSIVEGTLEDAAIIEEQAEKADIVINVASCDHGLCAKGKLSSDVLAD